MDIDQSLDDRIAAARKTDRPSQRGRSNSDRRNVVGGGVGRRGGGGGGGSGRDSPNNSGRNTPVNMRPSPILSRPPPRSADEAWTHDLYAANNNRSDRGGRGGVELLSRGGGGGQGNNNENNTRIVVTNVHYEVTKEDLESIFSRVGKIVAGPNIRYDRSGRSTGVATLEYERPRSARDAINQFDGNLAKGQALNIKFDETPIRRGPPGGPGAGAGAASSLLNRIQGAPTGLGHRIQGIPAGPAAGAAGHPRGGLPLGPAVQAPRPRSPAVRGGRGTGIAGGGRGGRGAGPKPARRGPATAEDLDKELESYHSTTKSQDATPAAAATLPDGDVEMS